MFHHTSWMPAKADEVRASREMRVDLISGGRRGWSCEWGLTLFTLEGSKYRTCCYQIKISMGAWESLIRFVYQITTSVGKLLITCLIRLLSKAAYQITTHVGVPSFKYSPSLRDASIPLPCQKTSFPSPFSSSSSVKHSKQPSSSPSSSVLQNKLSLETKTSSNSWQHQMILQTQNQWTTLFNVDAFFASWECRYELFVHC